jgi:aconitate hydratase
LVVAFALAGTVDIDLTSQPLGEDSQGNPVFLRDIWPTSQEIQQTLNRCLTPRMFTEKYANVFSGNDTWNAIQAGKSEIYAWQPGSTYIQEPPFFTQLTRQLPPMKDIHQARVLVLLGDSVTTDHISPAGAIPVDSPAGKYLVERGVQVRDFNSFGSRRGNDQVMTRGTFGNIRLKNRMVPGVEGGFTLHLPDGKQMSIYDASRKYVQEGVELIVLAGKEYGTGSSRDWAAKGTLLLGVKAIIAESYERIHRSNLVGMGVLPLQFMPDEGVDKLGLTGHEKFDIIGLVDEIIPYTHVSVQALKEDGRRVEFQAIVRLDTIVEVEYYRNGGILHTVLRKMLMEKV